ncbi:MAG: hypothetical protein MMC23_002196 [Stictis urceolatum]|nr:hypothetical protein [Stictis urceolata]
MVPCTIRLLTVPAESTPELISSLKTQEPRPLTIAHAHHWISPSHLCATLRDNSSFNICTILPGSSATLPASIKPLVTSSFHISIELADEWISNYASRNKDFLETEAEDPSPFPAKPTLPEDPEEDLEFPLTESLREFISNFSHTYNGPVSMLNLLAFYPGKQPMYQKYIEGFAAALGPMFGNAPRLIGGIVGHEEQEQRAETLWELLGLIHYPNVASFGRMLENDAYKELDRTYKRGVVKDNPIVCLVEIDMD